MTARLRLKVLLVEDLPTDAELVVRALKGGGIDAEWRRVDTREDFLSALDGFCPDVIISDFSMPSFDGMSALRLARELDPILPFIILTGSMNEDTAVECMKANASDYVIKEHMTRLPFAVEEALARHSLQVETARKSELLRESEEKYRFLFEASDDAVLLFANGGWVDCNARATSVFGCLREQIIGSNPGSFSPPTQPDGRPSEEEACRLIGLAYTTGPQSFEWEHCRADGTTFTAEVNLSRMDLAGKPHIQAIVRDISGRKQAEIALRDEKARLTTILDLVGMPIFVKDNDHRITSANRAFCEMFGLDDVIGRTLVEAVPENERKHFLEVDRRVLDTGVTDQREEELTVGGFTRTIITRKTRFIDESGNRFMVGSIYDITGRKQAEEALLRKDALLKLTGRMAKVGGWEIDVKTGQQTWTDETYAIYEVDRYFNPNVANGIAFYAPSARPVIEKAVQRAINFGEPFDVELEFFTYKANHRWVHSIGEVYQENGKITKIYGSIQDITERRHVVDALRESELRFHQMFEKHDTIMLLIEPQTGLILDANQSAAKFYGYEKSRLLMMNINDLNTQPQEQVAEERRKALNEERNYFVFTHRMANGAERIVEVHSSPISINEKKVLFSVIHDVTERKQAEAVISSYATRLSLSMKAANMAWWEMDINTGHVVFDERKAEMLGYPSGKFQHYNDFMALVHPDDHDTAMNAMKAHLEGTVEKYEVEYRILTKTGEYKWFHDIGAIEKMDSNGAPHTVAGIVINVTARRQVEESLLRQLDELKRWQTVTVDREERVIELKKEVNDLLKEAGRPGRYGE